MEQNKTEQNKTKQEKNKQSFSPFQGCDKAYLRGSNIFIYDIN